MSDSSGDPNWNTPTETWDPVLHRNVSTPQGAATYIAANPQNFQGYTGAVQSYGSTPIHVSAFTGQPSAPSTPSGFNPEALQIAQEQNAMNPYAGSPLGTQGGTDELSRQIQSWMETVRRIPGGNPTYGVLPGSSLYYNLKSYQQEDPNKLDPYTRYFGQMTQQRPGKIPTLAQTGGPGKISGRGYNFSGALTPEQQRAAQAAQAGNPRAAQWLASQLGRNWKANQLSPIQQYARQYYGPAIMAATGLIASGGVGAALGPMWGAGVGAGMGGLSAGAQSHWQDPAAIGIGTAGGFAGGYGGGALGKAVGAGAIGTGALSAAGGSLGQRVPMQAYRGNWDAGQLARDAGIAAILGGGMAGLGQLGKGGYVNTPGEPGGGFQTKPTIPPEILKAVAPQIKTAAGTTLDYYLPGRNAPPNPYAERQKAEEEARRRRLALTQQRQSQPRRR